MAALRQSTVCMCLVVDSMDHLELALQIGCFKTCLKWTSYEDFHLWPLRIVMKHSIIIFRHWVGLVVFWESQLSQVVNKLIHLVWLNVKPSLNVILNEASDLFKTWAVYWRNSYFRWIHVHTRSSCILLHYSICNE